MKIGIITTHYALNYGAFLQAMALQKILTAMGHDCEIIDYRPKNDKFGRDYIHKIRGVQDIARNVYAILLIKVYSDYVRRRKKFDDTRKKEIRLSRRIYTSREDILQYVEQYDAFICGSDQIWNLRLMFDSTYFLDFFDKHSCAKYIAYAPSISMTEFNDSEKQFISKQMRHFDAISVREPEGKALLSPLTEKEIKVVLDPVFLYGTENWKKFSTIPKGFNIQEPYIFCYYIGSSKLAQIAIEKLRNITGYKVVYCNVNLRDRFRSDICIRDASPQEYIGLIENASFICSNSFHGTAFSVLFQKPFIVTLNRNGRDSRMVDLLSSIQLNDRIYDMDNVCKLDTNAVKKCSEGYEQAIPMLKNLVNESMDYLKKSLN